MQWSKRLRQHSPKQGHLPAMQLLLAGPEPSIQTYTSQGSHSKRHNLFVYNDITYIRPVILHSVTGRSSANHLRSPDHHCALHVCLGQSAHRGLDQSQQQSQIAPEVEAEVCIASTTMPWTAHRAVFTAQFCPRYKVSSDCTTISRHAWFRTPAVLSNSTT